jgi:hypothetical protein
MSGGWQINDMALCIKQGLWRDNETGEVVEFGPKAGQLLTVLAVTTGWSPKSRGRLLLRFKGFGSKDYYGAQRFIKITPEDSGETGAQSQLALDADLPAELVEAHL